VIVPRVSDSTFISQRGAKWGDIKARSRIEVVVEEGRKKMSFLIEQY